MSQRNIPIKAAWIAAVAAVIVAIISQIPSVANLLQDNSGKNDAISIKNTKDSSIITGNNNTINNQK